MVFRSEHDTDQSSMSCGPINYIHSIHRGHDGFITCHHKDESGKWHDGVALRASELKGYFPFFIDQLTRDAYFSINGFKDSVNPTRSKKTGLTVRRRESCVLYLTACYCDLDIYQRNISEGQVLGALLDLQTQGAIVPPSMYCFSGRGVWPLWLLGDESGKPVLATPENKNVYLAILREINNRLRELGADFAAKDIARTIRVPGSINPKVQRQVRYLISADDNGQGYLYTLQQLQDVFRATPKPDYSKILQRPYKRTAPDQQTPKQRRAASGWVAMHEKRLEKFNHLLEYRGCFKEGCRTYAVLVYGHTISKLHRPNDSDLYRTLLQFAGKECRPSLDRAEVQQILRTIRKRDYMARITDQQISDWLQVTPEEANLTGWPPALVHGIPTPPEPILGRNEVKKARQECIRQIIASLGYVPPLRELAGHLEENGINAALNTLRADIKTLGIVNPRASKAEEFRALQKRLLTFS